MTIAFGYLEKEYHFAYIERPLKKNSTQIFSKNCTNDQL